MQVKNEKYIGVGNEALELSCVKKLASCIEKYRTKNHANEFYEIEIRLGIIDEDDKFVCDIGNSDIFNKIVENLSTYNGWDKIERVKCTDYFYEINNNNNINNVNSIGVACPYIIRKTVYNDGK